MATAPKVGKSAKTAGNRGKGRKPGVPNKTTAVLKDAILVAATQVGSDMKGAGGLTGYLKFLAKAEPKAFSGLLGRVLPMQVTGADGNSIVVEIVKRTYGDHPATA